jgi:hypothetical protein
MIYNNISYMIYSIKQVLTMNNCSFLKSLYLPEIETSFLVFENINNQLVANFTFNNQQASAQPCASIEALKTHLIEHLNMVEVKIKFIQHMLKKISKNLSIKDCGIRSMINDNQSVYSIINEILWTHHLPYAVSQLEETVASIDQTSDHRRYIVAIADQDVCCVSNGNREWLVDWKVDLISTAQTYLH